MMLRTTALTMHIVTDHSFWQCILLWTTPFDNVYYYEPLQWIKLQNAFLTIQRDMTVHKVKKKSIGKTIKIFILHVSIVWKCIFLPACLLCRLKSGNKTSNKIYFVPFICPQSNKLTNAIHKPLPFELHLSVMHVIFITHRK